MGSACCSSMAGTTKYEPTETDPEVHGKDNHNPAGEDAEQSTASNNDEMHDQELADAPESERSRLTVSEELEVGYENPSPPDMPYPPSYQPPLPTEVMGSYSTHGLMPNDEGRPPIKVNQDFGSCTYPFRGSTDKAFFLVCDGHGRNGTVASQTTANAINDYLENAPEDSESTLGVPELLSVGCESAWDTLECGGPGPTRTRQDFNASGTTMISVLVSKADGKCWSANVGDSRAVIGRADGSAAPLSRDHKVTDPDERDRIIACGGQLSDDPAEAHRVMCFKYGMKYALGMSRSIGDFLFESAGVSHLPEIGEFDLQAEDKWLILASDGIWEFISDEEAVEIVCAHADATMACRSLIARAKELWREVEGDYRDDITASVVDLQGMQAHMAVTAPLHSGKVSSRSVSPSLRAVGPGLEAPDWFAAEEPPCSESDATEKEGAVVTHSQSRPASFIRRRGSMVPTTLDELEAGLNALELGVPASAPDPVPEIAPRRNSITSPEMDMNLWTGTDQ